MTGSRKERERAREREREREERESHNLLHPLPRNRSRLRRPRYSSRPSSSQQAGTAAMGHTRKIKFAEFRKKVPRQRTVRPRVARPSNVKLVRLAISHVCLAGHHLLSAKVSFLSLVFRPGFTRWTHIFSLFFSLLPSLSFSLSLSLFLSPSRSLSLSLSLPPSLPFRSHRPTHPPTHVNITAGGRIGRPRASGTRVPVAAYRSSGACSLWQRGSADLSRDLPSRSGGRSCGEDIGLGPVEIGETEIVGFYKYNSGRKTFQKIRSESLTSTTDAIAISKEKTVRVVDDDEEEVELGMEY